MNALLAEGFLLKAKSAFLMSVPDMSVVFRVDNSLYVYFWAAADR
jgi:hypothetical protein